MNCPKCRREMLISHVVKEITDSGEDVKRIYTCVNKNCSEYSEDCRIKQKMHNS